MIMKPRHGFALALLIGLTLPAHSQEGVLKQEVPGVWFREGETRPGTRVILCANTSLIELKDYLIKAQEGLAEADQVRD
jgi:hypothetical protein